MGLGVRHGGGATVLWQEQGTGKAVLEKGQRAMLQKVPLTGTVLGEEGQAKAQRRKCHGLMPLALQLQSHFIMPKDADT